MKISYMSDLHLEFAPMVDLPGGDILLLAGDIFVVDLLREDRTDRRALLHKEEAKYFLDQASSKYNKIYYIPGNHEHYHGEVATTLKSISNFLSSYDNVFIMDDNTLILNDEYALFGSTFWTDMHQNDPMVNMRAVWAMNDFRMITHNEKTLDPSTTYRWNAVSRNCLAYDVDSLYNKHKFIVMTHHCPDLRSCNPKYGTDAVNYAYCNTDLENFILDRPRITHWIHGHTHDSYDYNIGQCRVLCNPRGYAKPHAPNQSENKMFNVNINFEI